MNAQEVADSHARVVLVDDTPDLRLLLKMVLELTDRYEVVAEAGDGATGIELVRELQPDLVLLDLAMPVMDGLEALPSILAACPTASVVVLSGFEADRMASQALELGATAYLQKGMRPDDMVDALDEALGRTPPPPLAAVPDTASEPDPPDELETLRGALATAAHELRTPTTVLIGLAQTVTRRRAVLDDKQIDDLLDAIVRQTMVLDRLTADLLTSSEASRGSLSAHPEEIDLLPALQAAAFTVSELSEVFIDAPDSLLVRADPVRVQQMLTNLLANAMKHAEPPISIVATRAGAQAVVRVDDSGAGVPADFRDRLFEQYSRSTTSRSGGSGLGLYVVKSLAEAQGGTAWYEPRVIGGSSFSFTLPLA